MVKKSRQQLIIKICCVIAAFALWLYTSNDETTSKVYKVSNIPVEIVNQDTLTQSGFVLSPNQNFTTSLKITGIPAEIYSVKPTEFKITADVGAYALKKGVNRIPINITKRPNKNINIVNDGSMWITVQVDDYVEKTLPIKPKFTGSFKNGTNKEPPVMTPDNVVVSGAKQYIDKIESVFAEIKIDSIKKDTTILAPLKAVDKTGTEMPHVTFSPKFVEVIIPAQKTKQVSINIKQKGKLNSNLKLSAIKPKTNTVIITGEPSALQKISKLDTEPIDLSSITSNNSYVKLKLIVPAGVKLIKSNPYVDVQVILNNKTQAKKIDVKIQTKNIQEGFSAKLDNELLSLSVSGAQDALNKISSKDIECFVDLRGLSEGEHNIPITVRPPSGIFISSQSFKSVKVKITKQTSPTKPDDNTDNDNNNSSDKNSNNKPSGNKDSTNTVQTNN